jgi:hypothetical protein
MTHRGLCDVPVDLITNYKLEITNPGIVWLSGLIGGNKAALCFSQNWLEMTVAFD